MVEGEVRECVAELQRALAPGEWRDALGLLLALARNVASEPENPRFCNAGEQPPSSPIPAPLQVPPHQRE